MALPAASIVDALVRLGLEVRLAPAFVRRAFPGEPIVGPAVPVRHFGSVDVFLEAYETAPPGGILVNGATALILRLPASDFDGARVVFNGA